MPDCKECGDVGLTLPESGVYPDFCTCDIGHDLNDRAHDYACEMEVDEIDDLVKHRNRLDQARKLREDASA